MGAAGERIKSCCAHAPCEGEQFTDKIQLAPVLEGPQNTLQDSSSEKNKEVIANHIRPPSKLPAELLFVAKPRISPEEIKLAPKIRIKVVASPGNLAKGTELEINAEGLEGSLRNSKDGVTYFGCEKDSGGKGRSELMTPLNDFVIPIKEGEMAERHFGRHFQIEYNPSKKKYFMRDLGKGFGVFVRIDYPQDIKDNNLLSMGESFLIANLIENTAPFSDTATNEPVFPRLRLKVFAGPSNGEVLYFLYFNPSPEQIKIGRHNTCEICIEDNTLSKQQAHIVFSPDKGWQLIDGYDGKISTNGTWLYISENFEIYDGLVFKAHQMLFKVSVVDKE